MAYDHSDHSQADADALKNRRAALRAFMQEVAESVQALQLPETYLEAERAARAVTVADRITQKLGTACLGEDEEDKQDTPPPPKRAVPLPINGAEKQDDLPSPSSTPERHDATSPADAGEEKIDDTRRVRLRLRAYADRVMEAATFIPKPDCFLEGERAGRYAAAAERMLTQLYAPPPKPKPQPFDTYDDDGDDAEGSAPYARPGSEWVEEEGMFQWQINLEQKLLRLAQNRREQAERKGFWDDGRPYIAEAPYSNFPPNPEIGIKAGPAHVPPQAEVFSTPAPDPQPAATPRSGGMSGYYAPRSQPP